MDASQPSIRTSRARATETRQLNRETVQHMHRRPRRTPDESAVVVKVAPDQHRTSTEIWGSTVEVRGGTNVRAWSYYFLSPACCRRYPCSAQRCSRESSLDRPIDGPCVRSGLGPGRSAERRRPASGATAGSRSCPGGRRCLSLLHLGQASPRHAWKAAAPECMQQIGLVMRTLVGSLRDTHPAVYRLWL